MRVMNDGFKKPKIKRCPFCGSEAHVEAYAVSIAVTFYTVVCNYEFCRVGSMRTDLKYGYATEDIAIEKWNRREKKWTSKKK